MASLRLIAAHLVLMVLVACGSDAVNTAREDTTDSEDDVGRTEEDDVGTTDDENDSSRSDVKDAGRSEMAGVKDAGGTRENMLKDGGAREAKSPDGGSSSSASSGLGSSRSGDAGRQTSEGDGGVAGAPTPPDLSSVPQDAGRAAGDAATSGRDPSGPCKDLNLFCFDIFDMFIFNPSDCFTCNGGMGCMGCAIPFAY